MRARGLQWQRTSDAIRAFVSRDAADPPRRAVLLTYDLDLPRFEAVLLPELTRRGRQFRTLVMADAGALQTHLKQIGGRHFGRFEMAPVRCRGAGVFHPKLVLLAAGARRLVGIGSANLTTGGLGGNLELMLFADDRAEAGRRVLAGAAAFLDALLESAAVSFPESARRFLHLVLAGLPRSRGDAVLHSLSEPLLDQMQRMSKVAVGRAQRVSVVSPWHSNARSPDATDVSVIRRIEHRLGKPVVLHTDGQDGRGPDVGSAIDVRVRAERAPSDEDDEAPYARRPIRVHAKAYLVEGTRAAALFIGSPNCTHPALTMTAAKGGNVEVLVGTRLGASETSAFRSDLDDLFAPAVGRFVASAPPRPTTAQGRILSGCLLKGRAGMRLELQAPGVRAADVRVAGRVGARELTVRVRHAAGVITDDGALRLLFADQRLPERASASWGSVLWEHLAGRWLPFPVTVPLHGGGDSGPDNLLEDLLLEEIGAWPSGPNEETDDQEGDEANDVNDDALSDELAALAEARHQGRLDRLAVAVALLRRRILGAKAGPAYARARLELVREQVRRMDLEPGLRRIVLGYLDGAPR